MVRPLVAERGDTVHEGSAQQDEVGAEGYGSGHVKATAHAAVEQHDRAVSYRPGNRGQCFD